MKRNQRHTQINIKSVKTQPSIDLGRKGTQDSFDLKEFLIQEQIRPETVVQSIDTRKGVINTNNWPFCAIGEIQSTFRKNGLQTETKGTITMVGQKIGITAAHNLYSHVYGQAFSSIVTLGRNGNYHIAKCFVKKPFIIPELYKKLPFSERLEFDYAFVVLDVDYQEDLKDLIGFVGMKSNFNPKLQYIGLFGYPQDKYSYDMIGQLNSYLYGDTGIVKLLPSSKNTFMYNIPTFAGQSGAALLCLQGARTKVVGIHTNGGRTVNLGIRLSNQMLQQARKQLHKFHCISLY